MQLKHFADLAVYAIVRVIVCIAQALTIETCHAVARGLAWLFGKVLRVRHRVIEDNLRHAFAELSEAQRQQILIQMWEHLFLFVAEIAHAPRKLHETNWREFITLRGSTPLIEALLTDRPVIMLTSHFGNFELGGYVMGILGFPTNAVARELDNPHLDRFLSNFRGATGQRIIPKNGGYDQIVEVLSHGGTMALLADQYAGRKGCWVDFFGRPASAHKAIALLALNHDAIITTGYARRLDRPLRYEFVTQAVADPRQFSESPDAVRELTQWYTSQFEKAIRTAPHQYWWVHRRWKCPTPKRKRPLSSAA